MMFDVLGLVGFFMPIVKDIIGYLFICCVPKKVVILPKFSPPESFRLVGLSMPRGVLKPVSGESKMVYSLFFI